MVFINLKGYEDKYEISTEYPYNIRNKKTNRILKETINTSGFVVVYLNKKHYHKHRLIAIQFIDNPNDYPYVFHINDIKTDNRIDNLIWTSSRDKCMNKSTYMGKNIVFFKYDDINEDDNIIIDSYGNHYFEGYYYNKQINKFLYDTGNKYKELNININEDGSEYIKMYETKGRSINAIVNKLKKLYKLN